MKKILFICLLLVSCKSEPTPNDKPSDIIENQVPFSKVYEFKYKGHDYIDFHYFTGIGDCSVAYGGVVHDPECKKCKEIDE